MATEVYEFAEDGFFGGTYYKKGDRASFDPRLVKHQKHWIKPVAAAPSKPVTAPAPKAAKKGQE